jgi:hypothetical protein
MEHPANAALFRINDRPSRDLGSVPRADKSVNHHLAVGQFPMMRLSGIGTKKKSGIA